MFFATALVILAASDAEIENKLTTGSNADCM